MKVGYVYKLVSDFTDDIYIGSTINKYLCNRLGQHKWDFKTVKSCMSRILFEFGEVKIECLEVVKYEDRQELRMKEREWIEKLPCINKQIPLQTKQEWKQKNIKKVRNYALEYYHKNKDKLNEVITCECGCKITTSNINRHLQTPKHINLLQINISGKDKDEPIL